MQKNMQAADSKANKYRLNPPLSVHSWVRFPMENPTQKSEDRVPTPLISRYLEIKGWGT